MKRRLLTMIVSLLLTLSLTAAFSFAAEDNIIPESDASTMLEKIDEAVIFLEEKQESTMMLLGDGTYYSKEVYPLDDGGVLTIELIDEAEDEARMEMLNQGILPRAMTGSNSLWKAYGKRYFTAKATVSFKESEVDFSLENHYTLSANGIDERYGLSNADTQNINCSIIEGPVVIDDSVARTPGESDVNLHCIFTIKEKASVTCKYKVDTTVKYLNHDKSNKKIKVRQSWSLKKV